MKSAMVYGVTAFLHKLFQIEWAQSMSHVPAYALQDDVFIVVVAFHTGHLFVQELELSTRKYNLAS